VLYVHNSSKPAARFHRTCAGLPKLTVAPTSKKRCSLGERPPLMRCDRDRHPERRPTHGWARRNTPLQTSSIAPHWTPWRAGSRRENTLPHESRSPAFHAASRRPGGGRSRRQRQSADIPVSATTDTSSTTCTPHGRARPHTRTRTPTTPTGSRRNRRRSRHPGEQRNKKPNKCRDSHQADSLCSTAAPRAAPAGESASQTIAPGVGAASPHANHSSAMRPIASPAEHSQGWCVSPS
jgi:hypothetical protein